MRKLILIAHTSLDGFVAGADGSLDGFEFSEENLEFVCKITNNADTALFGRVSYQLLDSYWPNARNNPNASAAEKDYSSWYNAAAKIVLSKTMSEPNSNNTTIIKENLPNEIARIKQQPGKDILIFGSPAAFQSLVQHDLVDEYWIFINPIIFGEGIPLFSGMEYRIKLKLLATKQFANGEFALNYVVARS